MADAPGFATRVPSMPNLKLTLGPVRCRPARAGSVPSTGASDASNTRIMEIRGCVGAIATTSAPPGSTLVRPP